MWTYVPSFLFVVKPTTRRTFKSRQKWRSFRAKTMIRSKELEEIMQNGFSTGICIKKGVRSFLNSSLLLKDLSNFVSKIIRKIWPMLLFILST